MRKLRLPVENVIFCGSGKGPAKEHDLEIAATSLKTHRRSHTEGVVATSVALPLTTAR